MVPHTNDLVMASSPSDWTVSFTSFKMDQRLFTNKKNKNKNQLPNIVSNLFERTHASVNCVSSLLRVWFRDYFYF